MEKGKYSAWQLAVDKDKTVWATLNRTDASANSINQNVLDELSDIIDHLNDATALVIQSGKDNGFILGADVNTFSDLSDIAKAMAFIRCGQALFDKLEQLVIPTLALIQGFCLGGGLELALACRYRIIEDSDKTRLGLPEVKLGIHPGWGGTVRLPRLVGAINALDLMLSGRMVRAKAAYRMGLVDAVVPRRHLLTACQHYLSQKPSPRQLSFTQKLGGYHLCRQLIAWQTRRTLRQKRVNAQHYPSVYAVVEQYEKYGYDNNDCIQHEAESIERVLRHKTAANLIRLFGLQEQLKGFGKQGQYNAKRLHVVGAGTMGGDIALFCAMKGMTVSLQDQTIERLAPVYQRASKLYKKTLKEPRLVQAALDRLVPDIDGQCIEQADIIIEAIFEDLAAKQALFVSLENKASSHCILATNTSTFPLSDIAANMSKPQRLVGIHFFNPVPKMMLVEVVSDKKTSKEEVKKALAFVGQIGKLPLPVRSSPGFLVNRLLMPYLMESMALVDEGINMSQIDKAAVDFGMPMGPIELADKVGLDICLYGAESLAQHFPINISQTLKDKVAAGHLGIKSNQGFYHYKAGKKQDKARETNVTGDKDVIHRLILRLINEGVACLREEVVDDPDLLDAAMVFGTGFAPFRGGPMHYVQEEGVTNIHAKLQDFQQRFGERFTPDPGWDSVEYLEKATS